jgi:hypothetical protein
LVAREGLRWWPLRHMRMDLPTQMQMRKQAIATANENRCWPSCGRSSSS